MMQQALEVFEATLRRNPANPIAQRRARDLRRMVSTGRPRHEVIRNGARTGDAGERVLRRARKAWRCEGKGCPPVHALECPREIAPGERYVEITWGEVGYFDSHRVSLDCARSLWGHAV
jgi:hypothetical protein